MNQSKKLTISDTQAGGAYADLLRVAEAVAEELRMPTVTQAVALLIRESPRYQRVARKLRKK